MKKGKRNKSPLVIEGKILLVDNEADIIDIYPQELRKQGLDVYGFTDPAVALEEFRLSHGEYILVVSDIRMPKMNGFEFIRSIKELKPNVKVAFITAFEINNNEFSTVLPSTKVDGFIQKPIAPSKLADMIKEMLSSTKLKESVA
jgi:DNA-binding NtrC family response regulator